MAQRYSDPNAQARMVAGMCPECGQSPKGHLADPRFWIPRACTLTADGVKDRITQHRTDRG